ncbi:hypothetical protein SUGI_0486430 [Cryptomeria japonica]|nr:hypothetical protein SUGI_0486430 [Cryptomeria japonica]
MNSSKQNSLSCCYTNIFVIVFLLFFTFSSSELASQNFSSLFDQNYNVTWGGYHVRYFDKRRIVQLVLDQSSGSGFVSKNKYLFGNFTMKMKLIHGDSSGTVTAYYLTTGDISGHDEVDFEFLGDKSGKFYRLQTNVFVDGEGEREERMRLWFDPTTDFHEYSILWDPNQILFMVDNNPIRVFKNLQKSIGVPYPSMKSMQVVASLWNGEDWATNGGKGKIKWKYSPFHVSFVGFDIQGCIQNQDEAANINTTTSNSTSCTGNGDNYPLTGPYSPKKLILNQSESLKHVRRYYITYSYCSDKMRFNHTPPECFYNSF